MKTSQLITLAEAAEIALPLLEERLSEDTKAAIAAAFLEVRKRLDERVLYRANRPSRTVRREAIREQLALHHHRVRLTRNGEWHVQTTPGTAWLQFALSDNDAENLLDPPGPTRSFRQACGCRHKHSDAAGVVAACQLGQDQAQDEMWTGYLSEE
jgi:hypothetical protein